MARLGCRNWFRWLQFPLWFLFAVVTSTALLLGHWENGNDAEFQATGKALDVAIAGPGFFQVQDSSGQFLYTRNGQLRISPNGDLEVGPEHDGLPIQPTINIPLGAYDLTIQRDGRVLVNQQMQMSKTQLGQLQLATFIAETGLCEVFPGFYAETDESGANQLGNPQIGSPVLLQGMLRRDDPTSQRPWFFGIAPFQLLAIIGVGWLLAELSRLRAAVARLERRTTHTDIPSDC